MASTVLPPQLTEDLEMVVEPENVLDNRRRKQGKNS